ncbi:MAG: asparagine synthase (glutamine-hydrolyzing) [Candidatus Brocadiia bacterium]
MCGICGIISSGPSRYSADRLVKSVERMTQTLRHRGPDDSGVECLHMLNRDGPERPFAVLGHRRLSVIDVHGGHQPLKNERGTVWTVYNGEIYNFPRLRARLSRRGHEFGTRCDTECLVHLYEDLSEELVEELRGMFAFALWDRCAGRLILARDRLGQKPLYYYDNASEGLFAFASELKALLHVPGFAPTVNPQAIGDFLSFQYVPHPQCIFAQVRKLPPSHVLSYDSDDRRSTQKRYWRPEFKVDHGPSAGEWRERLYSELETAVSLRLMSDVPLGAFLSGGVDSSATVALMNQLTDDPIRTFTIGFDDERYDESAAARLVANHCGSSHILEYVRPDALKLLSELVWHYDEPFGDSSAVPTYYLSELARRHVKVVLTGDAGDECFAGYARYAAARLGEMFDRSPSCRNVIAHRGIWRHIGTAGDLKNPLRRLRRFLLGLNYRPHERYLRWINIFDPDLKDTLLAAGLRDSLDTERPLKWLNSLYSEVEHASAVHTTTYVDMMSYLPGDLLTKVDTATMAHGLEARSPFLDHRVVELAGRMPERYKMRLTHRGLEGKLVLKEAFSDMLPRPILRRSKMGFGVPIARWFRNELREPARDILLSRRSLERGYFNPHQLETLLEQHQKGRANHGAQLWCLLMLELWHRQFMDSAGDPAGHGVI